MRKIPMLGVALSMLVTGLAAATQTQPQAPPAQTPAQPPASPEVVLNVGDQAPAFSLPGSDGKTHKLSDYKGKAVVIAWFPAAMTAG